MSSKLALFAGLLLAAASARAADTGQFLFQNAAPQPVGAGDPVHFQVIAVNQGSAAWEANRTFLEVEIYDSKKVYAAKSDRQRPAADVGPGKTLTADISYAVPSNYDGSYYYRVFLVHDDQRIVQGDYQALTVIGKPTAPAGPSPVTAGGNVMVSYRTETGANPDLTEVNANLLGQILGRPYDFNASAFHRGDDGLDLRSILFNYHGKSGDLGLGDVSPNFSPLSVSGSGVRGALVKTKEIPMGPVKVVLDATGAMAVKPHEGSATTDGTFQRNLYGGQASFLLPRGFTVRANMAEIHDLPSSLDTPGPTLVPVENQTQGFGAGWSGMDGLKFDADWQHSSFNANTRSTAPAVGDDAWRLAMGLTRRKWNLNASVLRAGTNFVNLATPGVAKDRLTYDLGLNVNPSSWLALNEGFNQYRDNLNDDPSKVKTTQRRVNSGAAVTLPSKTVLNAGVNLNQVYGAPLTAVNNRTVGENFGVTQPFPTGSVTAGYARSDFTDMTGATNDLLTNSYNANWSWKVHPRLNATLGANFSSTKDKKDGSTTKTRTYSASANAIVKPSKIFAQGFLSMTQTKDDDLVARSDRRDTNANLEFTWKATSSLSLSAGGFTTVTRDAVIPSRDGTVNGMTLRAGYSF